MFSQIVSQSLGSPIFSYSHVFFFRSLRFFRIPSDLLRICLDSARFSWKLIGICRILSDLGFFIFSHNFSVSLTFLDVLSYSLISFRILTFFLCSLEFVRNFSDSSGFSPILSEFDWIPSDFFVFSRIISESLEFFRILSYFFGFFSYFFGSRMFSCSIICLGFSSIFSSSPQFSLQIFSYSLGFWRVLTDSFRVLRILSDLPRICSDSVRFSQNLIGISRILSDLGFFSYSLAFFRIPSDFLRICTYPLRI